MKITNIKIANFRGLKFVELTNLGSGIVVAGPNGCGKSCLLEALRGLKSAYGSYDQDEWTKWCQEFGIDLNGKGNVYAGIFQDKDVAISIEITFQLSAMEKTYMRENMSDLLRNSVWSQNIQPHALSQPRRRVSLAENLRNNNQQLAERLALLRPLIESKLDEPWIEGRLTISPTGDVELTENQLLEFIFATYDPQHLGIIDYYSANRRYNRSGASSINLSPVNSEQQRRQFALFGPEKAGNLKAEMSGTFISKLLISASQETGKVAPDDALTASLKDLFANFFPGKEFLGPTPTADGKLSFPVRLANGATHDIDELSSGEKEIVYGYLRIYTERHKDSVIIIDEPELHLNPRLTSGLVAFYFKHLAAEGGNQIWLVTHSDAIIRDAVALPIFQVYHFQPPLPEISSQSTLVSAKNETDNLIFDLVGDMAAYRPGAKLIVLESSKDIQFDRRMLERLFPNFSQRVNYISAGNRDDVTRVHKILRAAQEEGYIHVSVYAIGDRDSEHESFANLSRFVWDVYHIENYLLSATHIFKTLRDSNPHNALGDEAAVWAALKACAEQCIPELAAHVVRMRIRERLQERIRFGLKTSDMMRAEIVFQQMQQLEKEVVESLTGDLSLSSIQTLIDATNNNLAESLKTDAWASRIPGKEILRRFINDYGGVGLGYPAFVEWIVTNMVSDGFQPPGMKSVLESIGA